MKSEMSKTVQTICHSTRIATASTQGAHCSSRRLRAAI
jgi:hypothetical protein